jgi:protoporphyrinogen oxidase
MKNQILILGGGLSGLAAAYHIGHPHCLILEKLLQPLGHIRGEQRDGFTWDPGPHVSFTKSEYVRELFAASVAGEFDEFEVKTGNYFKGHWIDHPAQTALYQIPEPLRGDCLASFLATRENNDQDLAGQKNYLSWLEKAFGPVFAHAFPAAYTRKYWTREPKDLTADWLGNRVYYPSIDDVIKGSRGPLGRPTHYISKVRYPRRGGYQSFAQALVKGCNIEYGAAASFIDLRNKIVRTADSRIFSYTKLISTLPLPEFIAACGNVPANVQEAAFALSCSQLLLVNVKASHPTRRTENWIYVYDEDKFSTRINCTEKCALGNAPSGSTGVQVEVYFSRHRPLNTSPTEVGHQVEAELVEMGLVDPQLCSDAAPVSHHLRYCPWANVIFDHDTRPCLDTIWSWLEQFGLKREEDDLSPTTDWSKSSGINAKAHLIFAGRFGQWKYFWTDDCVLRGAQVSSGGFQDSLFGER